jgi:pimeloyl-ACP methyl ester carboxylesterase
MTTAATPDTGEGMETITSADGTEIAFEQTGSGSSLVLIHGIGLDHLFWDLSNLRPALAEDFTVSAITRRGRGGSGDADVYELEREIEDVAAVVESIDGPVTLLGHSYGALVSLEVALRTDNLHGLVLYEPLFAPIPPEIEQLLGAIKDLLANGQKEQALVTCLTAVGVPEASLEELRSNPGWQALVDAADTIPREFEGFFQYEFEADRFEGMTTPTVLFCGEDSHPGLVVATETVDETLPDGRIVRFDGAGHFGLISNTNHFVEEILAFFEES